MAYGCKQTKNVCMWVYGSAEVNKQYQFENNKKRDLAVLGINHHYTYTLHTSDHCEPINTFNDG